MASGIFNVDFTPTAITPSSIYEHDPFLNDLQKFKLISDEQTQKNEFFDFIRAKITSHITNATREKYEKIALIYGEDQLGISKDETLQEIKKAYKPTSPFHNLHQGNPTKLLSERRVDLNTIPNTSVEKEELKQFLKSLGQSASTTSLERALKEREAELAEQKKASQALEAANATLKSNLTQLQSSNSEQQQKLAEAAKQLSDAQLECKQTKDCLQQEEAAKLAESVKANKLEEQLKVKTEQEAKVKADYEASLKSTMDQLQQRLEKEKEKEKETALEMLQEEASAQATQLTEKIAKLQSALDESQKTLADQAAENERYKAEMTHLSAQHASEQEDLQSQLEQAKSKEAEFNEIAEKLEDQAELKIQIATLQAQLAEQAQSAGETYQKQITELSKQHESDLKRKTDELQAKIEALSTKITELENQQPEAAPLLNISVQPPLNSSAAVVEEKDVANARTLLKQLKENYEHTKDHINPFFSTRMRNENFIIWNNLIRSEKTSELLDNIDNIEPALVIQMAPLIKSLIDAQKVVLGTEILLKDPMVKEKLNRLQQLEADYKSVKNENNEILDRQTKQLTDLQSKQQQITQLQQQLKKTKKHEEDNESLKEVLELLRIKLIEQESKHEAALTAAHQRLEQEKSTFLTSAQEESFLKTEHLTKQIRQLQRSLEESEKKLTEQKSKAAAELQDQKDQLSTQHADQVTSMQQKIDQSNSLLQESKKKLTEQALKAAAELQKQRDLLSTQHATEVASMQQHIAESEIHKEENIELKASIQTLESRLKQQESDHQIETEQLKQTEQEQGTLIQQKEAENKSLKDMVEELTAILPFPPDQMNNHLQDLHEIIIKHGNQKIKRAIPRILETIEAKNKEADKKLQSVDELIKSLTQENERLTVANEDIQKSLTAYKTNLKTTEFELTSLKSTQESSLLRTQVLSETHSRTIQSNAEELSTMRASLELKDITISDLQNQIGTHEEQLKSLQALLEETNDTLRTEYERRLKSQNITNFLNQYDTHIQSPESQRQYVQSVVQVQLEELGSLRKKLGDLEPLVMQKGLQNAYFIKRWNETVKLSSELSKMLHSLNLTESHTVKPEDVNNFKKLKRIIGKLATANNKSRSPDTNSENFGNAATPLKVVKQLRSRTERKSPLARTPGRSTGNQLRSMSQPTFTGGNT